MKIRVSFLSIVFLVCAFYFIGCVTAEKTTYSTLSVSQTTFDTTLSILGDMYKAGKITEAQKTEIVATANKYKEAHNLAVNAFLIYKNSGLDTDNQTYIALLAKSTALLTEFFTLAQPYLK